MSQPTKRPRGDDDAAEQPTEGSAVGASASAASARPNEPAVEMLHGVAIEMSYIYTTMYHPAAVLYLLADGQVSFQQGDRPACCQHGNWAIEADQGTLRVWFHYNASLGHIRMHVFVRLPHTTSYELQGTHAEYRAFLIPRNAAAS
jgi:hypothetical protein